MVRISLIVAVLLAAPGQAAAFGDPDWPCVQRKITRLSWGQMWSGPPLPEGRAWAEDAEVAALASEIAARRTPMEAVEARVAGLAGEEARLVALFAGAFEIIDRERTRIVGGIERYSAKQRALSEHIDAMRLEIVALEAETGPEDFDALDRLEEMQDRLTWDTRIYDERRRSLTYVCETPVILEKRAFAVAKIIEAALE